MCPQGFEEGSVKWDDEDWRNGNKMTGALPEGRYDRNTRIFFCCRNDGHATNAINLPTDKPFVLFKYTHQCQHVTNTKIKEEFFRWDNEDDSPYISEAKGKHPFLEKDGNNLKVHYCYYYK